MQKKIGLRAGKRKKRSMLVLRIQKKDRIGNRQTKKKIGQAAVHHKKIPGREPAMLGNVRPMTLFKTIRGVGCPPKLLPPPSPRFSFFANRPPPHPSGKNGDPAPPCFQSQKVCFAWSLRRAGKGGGLPLRLWARGVGYRSDGVGVPSPAKNLMIPPARNFLAGPHPPAHAQKGRGGGSR